MSASSPAFVPPATVARVVALYLARCESCGGRFLASWPALDDDTLSGAVSDFLGAAYSLPAYRAIHDAVRASHRVSG